ncbi:hypothetical protein [Nostoc sp. 2RC]|uniref:hypothetical protein n=1 Tax=Nostoc sp. 2RC TaxID=2485484 RepID=UPI0016231A4D|nr:hypothetical protein [Nostoc sp. 2RC]MBC1237592.1 hypothetical protein [Nostoc sp. 2RC]
MRIKGNWNILKIFISGLTTAIFINYLFAGFVDVVINIDSLLTWLQNSGIDRMIKQMFK